jgi:hypothetical protein
MSSIEEVSAPAEAPPDPAKGRAMANVLLLAVAVALAMLLFNKFAPWLVSTFAVTTVIAAVGTIVGVFNFGFKGELEARFTRIARHPASRAIVVIALIAQLPLALALWYVAGLPIIRIVPGPELDAQLGFAGQTLRVTLDDGSSFTFAKPAPRPLYVGRWQDRVRHAIDTETKDTRVLIFESILRSDYKIDSSIKDDSEEAAGFVKRWQLEPQLMDPAGRGSDARLTAALEEGGNPARPLRLTEVELPTSDGVPTYVAKFVQ